MLIEVGLAAAILASVAALHTSGPRPWSAVATPRVQNTLHDISALHGQISGSGQVSAQSVQALHNDAAELTGLAPPPGPDVGAAWALALGSLAGALTTLEAQTQLSGGAAARVEAELGFASTQLLAVSRDP